MSISEGRVMQLALERLESQLRDIEAEIAELKNRYGSPRVERRGRPRKDKSIETRASNAEAGSQPKKRMSEEHRLAIAQAMKKRWAERKSEAG